MKIQIASDLHLEFYRDKPRNGTLFTELLTPCKEADILILAGDIGYPEDAITRDFIHWCCSLWPEVFWVFGNHEYYNKDECFRWKYSKKHYTMKEKEEMVPALENLHIGNGAEVFEYDIPILGTTLWTDASNSEITGYMSDFTYIKQNDGYPLKLSEWSSRHAVERTWLLNELDRLALEGRKAIVVTHHLPTYKMIAPKFEGHPCNSGFASHADELVTHPGVAVWICGHSHGQREVVLEGKRVILNARGYPQEDSRLNYNPKLLVEISSPAPFSLEGEEGLLAGQEQG
jgi:predicted phosphodiesterase